MSRKISLLALVIVVLLSFYIHHKTSQMARFRKETQLSADRLEASFRNLTGQASQKVFEGMEDLHSFRARINDVEEYMSNFYQSLIDQGLLEKDLYYHRLESFDDRVSDATILVNPDKSSPFLDGAAEIQVGGASKAKIIMRFDKMNVALPPDAQILSMKLHLKVKVERKLAFEFPVHLSLYPVTNPWSEGNVSQEGVNWYLTGINDNTWSLPGLERGGSDMSEVLLARRQMTTLVPEGEWQTFYFRDSGVKYFQGRLHQGQQGWLIEMNDLHFGAITFHSSEAEDPADRPFLEIYYTLRDK